MIHFSEKYMYYFKCVCQHAFSMLNASLPSPKCMLNTPFEILHIRQITNSPILHIFISYTFSYLTHFYILHIFISYTFSYLTHFHILHIFISYTFSYLTHFHILHIFISYTFSVNIFFIYYLCLITKGRNDLIMTYWQT